jgi:glycine cleavage system transcriptional repressor
MESSQTRFVASVLVADRPGIMRDISGAVTALDGNIDDVSQTVVEGYFTVILTTSFEEPVEARQLQAAIERNFASGEASIAVRPFRPVARPDALVSGKPYVLTVTGPDRKGIIKAITTLLADKGINIEDWACFREGTSVTYIGELTVPPSTDTKQIQEEFSRLLKDLGVQCSVQHMNIFRATNEIGPIKSLLGQR